jgi:sugar/nucleoside kinase (ribokinase family)
LIKANYLEAYTEIGQSYPIGTMARWLSAKYNCQIIITNGENGMIWANGDVFGHTPACVATVVDRTGCGDAVVAAVAMNVHKPLDKICELAAVEAAKCVGQLGVSPASL